MGLGMKEFILDNLEDIKGDNEKSFCNLMSKFLVNGSPEYDRPTWRSVIEALDKAELGEISKQLYTFLPHIEHGYNNYCNKINRY